MQDRKWMGLLLGAAAAIALFVVALLMMPDDAVSKDRKDKHDDPPKTEATAAEATTPATAATPATSPASPPGQTPATSAPETAPPSVEAVETPAGEPPYGLVFGFSVCEKMNGCACEVRNEKTCAHDWSWVKQEDQDVVKCVLDLPCADVCRHSMHPKDVPCLVAVDAVHAKKLGFAPWEQSGPAVPGIVTGQQ